MEVQNRKGVIIQIDPEDLPLVTGSNGRTCFSVQSKGYICIFHQGKSELLHRVIAKEMGLSLGDSQVDHANRNKLDNRRENLRLATGSQNIANRSKQSGMTSAYKGVYWRADRNRWVTQIRDPKHRTIGHYLDPVEAARAYDRAALAHFGAFAVLNFPA